MNSRPEEEEEGSTESVESSSHQYPLGPPHSLLVCTADCFRRHEQALLDCNSKPYLRFHMARCGPGQMHLQAWTAAPAASVADRNIVGLARRVPQRPKVKALAVAHSSTSAVQIAADRSLVGVGMDMVEMAVRELRLRVSVGEECCVGWDVRDAESAETA